MNIEHFERIAREWYSFPEVARAVLQFLGHSGELPENVSLTNPFLDATIFRNLRPDYLLLSNDRIKQSKHGSPARTIFNEELTRMLHDNPLSEIGMSLRSRVLENKDHPEVRGPIPMGGVLAWDTEYYQKI